MSAVPPCKKCGAEYVPPKFAKTGTVMDNVPFIPTWWKCDKCGTGNKVPKEPKK